MATADGWSVSVSCTAHGLGGRPCQGGLVTCARTSWSTCADFNLSTDMVSSLLLSCMVTVLFLGVRTLYGPSGTVSAVVGSECCVCMNTWLGLPAQIPWSPHVKIQKAV